jgi:hypothetical protein
MSQNRRRLRVGQYLVMRVFPDRQDAAFRTAAARPQARQPDAPDSRGSTGPLLALQRTHGNRSVLQLLRSGVLQPKLTVSQPGDHYEQEADRVADQIVQMGEPGPAPPAGVAKQTSRTIQTESASPDRSDIASEVESSIESLDGHGEPLSDHARAFFEPRFGCDFSGVRIHTDAKADEAARSVNARAFTVGHNVVFRRGDFAPDSSDGRWLLAHELTHVVQQNAASTDSGRGLSTKPAQVQRRVGSENVLQRVCAPAMAPAVAVDVGGGGFNWEAAENCLIAQYPRAGLVGSNKDWKFLNAPRTTPEGMDLNCFKSHLVAKSGMFLAQPDIIDFTRAEIYDVTTVGQAYNHHVRLWADVGEATALANIPDCSGSMRTWQTGTWQPAPYYMVGPDMFMRTWNDNGLLLYQMLRDLTKEVITALILATIYQAFKNQIGKGLATALAKKAPPVAAAYAALTVFVLLTTDAELAFGAEGEDPVSALIDSMEKSAGPIPDEIKQALKSDPQLKARLDAAMKMKGSPSEKQKRISSEMMKLIAENKDKFSREDLEALVQTMEATTSDKGPDRAPTLEALKSELERIKKGEKPDPGASEQAGEGTQGADTPKTEGGKGEGGAGKEGEKAAVASDLAKKYPGLKTATIDKMAASPDLVRQLWERMVSTTEKGPAVTDENVEKFLTIVPAGLTQKQFDALVAKLQPVKDQTAEQVLDGLAKAVAAVQQAERAESNAEVSQKYPKLKPETVEKLAAADPLVKELFDKMTTGAKKGVPVTDEIVERFLKIFAGKLTPAEYEAIAGSLRDIKPGETADKVLANFEKALAAASKAKGAEPGKGKGKGKGKGADVKSGGKPGKGKKPDDKAHQEFLQKMAAAARRLDYSRIKPGDFEVFWEGATVKDMEKQGWLFYKTDEGKKSLAFIKLKLIDMHDDQTARVHILEATQTVDEDANVVLESEELEGRTLDITLHENTAAAAP